jgi:transaldolase / glucose-6-phosphate isomerase
MSATLSKPADYIRRSLITGGELKRLIDEDGLAFGVVKAAQARGDFQVLTDRNRRALRVHLADIDSGLAALQSAIAKALS